MYNTLGEFILNSINKRLDESKLKITKLYREFNIIKQLEKSKVTLATHIKILASTKTKQNKTNCFSYIYNYRCN